MPLPRLFAGILKMVARLIVVHNNFQECFGHYRIYSNKRRFFASQMRRLFKNWNISIELSRLLQNFLEANAENRLLAEATGKRKREVGLVVPAKFTAFTTELRIARILDRELNGER